MTPAEVTKFHQEIMPLYRPVAGELNILYKAYASAGDRVIECGIDTMNLGLENFIPQETRGESFARCNDTVSISFVPVAAREDIARFLNEAGITFKRSGPENAYFRLDANTITPEHLQALSALIHKEVAKRKGEGFMEQKKRLLERIPNSIYSADWKPVDREHIR
jgi:hypothetical protein